MNARVHCGPDFITDGQQRDHDLSGNYKGTRECHIEPDWLGTSKLRLHCGDIFFTPLEIAKIQSTEASIVKHSARSVSVHWKVMWRPAEAAAK